MSRGSTLTLYKKYNLKMEDKDFEAVVKKYENENKQCLFSTNDKDSEGNVVDLPKIMDIDAFRKTSFYDKKKKQWIQKKIENNICNLRKKAVGFVDRDDRMYCSEMMNWNFGSSFDCLVEHFNIGHYNFRDSVVEITPAMAQQMLDAINYLLGGNWNDSLARTMNNPFISIFSEGGNCDSYWKYVYRNRKKTKQKTFKISEDGYDITIKCPVENKKNKKNGDKDDEYYYETELEESNSSIEYNLETFRNGLISFLKSDNWERHEDDEWLGYADDNKYKYVLTYEYWG